LRLALGSSFTATPLLAEELLMPSMLVLASVMPLASPPLSLLTVPLMVSPTLASGGRRRPADRLGEPADDGRPASPASGRRSRSCSGAAGRVRPDRRGGPACHDLLRRHALAAGPGHDSGGAAARHLPRRTHHWARPPRPARRLSTSMRPMHSQTESPCSTGAVWWPPAAPPSSSAASGAATST